MTKEYMLARYDLIIGSDNTIWTFSHSHSSSSNYPVKLDFVKYYLKQEGQILVKVFTNGDRYVHVGFNYRDIRLEVDLENMAAYVIAKGQVHRSEGSLLLDIDNIKFYNYKGIYYGSQIFIERPVLEGYALE